MLSGTRVLDLSGLLPGPYASLLLADMGAEVIKVESPLGDLMRQVPPTVRGHGAYFLSVNRNKRSFGVSLKKAAGRELFVELARESDVVIEGFRPGRAARLGIGPEALHAAHPGLVYCSISGYGQTGPDSGRAGHDLTYLARGGALSLSRCADGTPFIPPLQIADLAAGTNAAMAICAALYERTRTGRGRVIDVSMLDAVVAWTGLHFEAKRALSASADEVMPLAGRFPFYNVYRTADGGFVTVAALEPLFWRDLCRAVGKPELEGLQFAHGADRRRTFEALAEVFGARTTAAWSTLFRERDLSAEIVASLDDVVNDEHLQQRSAFLEVEHPDGGAVRQAAPPLRVDGQAPRSASAPPRLGADTRWVLETVLALDAARVESLFRERVVFGAEEAAPRRIAPEELR